MMKSNAMKIFKRRQWEDEHLNQRRAKIEKNPTRAAVKTFSTPAFLIASTTMSHSLFLLLSLVFSLIFELIFFCHDKNVSFEHFSYIITM